MQEVQKDNIMYLTNNVCLFCGTSIEDGFGTLSLFGAVCERCKKIVEKDFTNGQ